MNRTSPKRTPLGGAGFVICLTMISSVCFGQDDWPVNDTPKAWEVLNTRQISTFYQLHEGVDVPAKVQNTSADEDGNKVLLPREMELYKKVDSGSNGKVRFKVTIGPTTYYCSFLHLRAIPGGLTEGNTYPKGEFLGYIGNVFADPAPDHLHFSVSTSDWEVDLRTAFEDAINPLSHYAFAASEKDPQGVRPQFLDRSNPKNTDADDESFQFKKQGTSTYITAKAADGNFIVEGDVDLVVEVQDRMNFSTWFPDVYKSGYYVIKDRVCGGNNVRSSSDPYILFEATELAVDDANNQSKRNVVYDPDKDFTHGTFTMNYQLMLTNTKGTTGAWDKLDAGQYWNTNAKGAGTNGGNGVGSDNEATKASEAWFPDGLYDVGCVAWDLIDKTDVTEPVWVENFPPAVKDLDPEDGAGDVSIDANVVIQFSEPMNKTSVEEAITWRAVGGSMVPYSATWNTEEWTITLDPTSSLAEDTEYEVIVDADVAEDQHGGTSNDGARLDSLFGDSNHNGTAQGSPTDDVTWSFTTGQEAECFLVWGSRPAYGTWSFLPGSHVFTTQVGEVEQFWPVLLDDIPEFVIYDPSKPLNVQSIPFGGASGRNARLVPGPNWSFTVQVLMWNPAVFPTNPEQYTHGLAVSVTPVGQVYTTPYGTSDGGMALWAETYWNAKGQRVLRFPFSIPGF